MSFLDKATDSVKSINPGIDGIGDNLLKELSPIFGDNKGLNILNEMRNAGSVLPKEFPSIEDIFGGNNVPGVDALLRGAPAADLFKSAQSLVPGADSVFANLGKSFPQIGNFAGAESLQQIFGSDPLKNLLGSNQGANGLFEGLPEPGNLAQGPLKGVENIFGSANPLESVQSFIGGDNPISSVTNVFLGDKAAGGLLGAVGGGEGGIGGLLGSFLGGEGGGIGGLLSQLGPIIEQILPLIAKIAPLTLGII